MIRKLETLQTTNYITSMSVSSKFLMIFQTKHYELSVEQLLHEINIQKNNHTF